MFCGAAAGKLMALRLIEVVRRSIIEMSPSAGAFSGGANRDLDVACPVEQARERETDCTCDSSLDRGQRTERGRACRPSAPSSTESASLFNLVEQQRRVSWEFRRGPACSRAAALRLTTGWQAI